MQKFLSVRLVRALLVVAVTAAAFGAAQLLSHAAQAVPAQQTWFDTTKLPEVAQGTTLAPEVGDTLFRAHMDMYGGHQCTPDDEGDCWYKAGLGQIEKNGYKYKIPFNDTIWYVDEAESQLIATPNPNAFMHIVPDPDTGLYHVYFRTSDTTMLTIGYNEGMPVATFGVPDTDSQVVELTHGNGQPWELDDNTLYSQIGYSANGQWMSVWSQSGYVVIVNLNDFSTRTINVGAPIDFALSTVSDDGRYVALSTTDGYLTLYDLSRCGTGALVDGVATQSCPVRDVGAALGAYLGNPEGELVEFGIPQFVEDDILKYTTHPDYQQYYIWAPNTKDSYEDPITHQYYSPPAATTNYIALGDSYASGEGVGNSNFYPETNVSGVNQCHLSLLSYPYLIAADLGLDSVHSVACSGAKIANVLTDAQYPQVPSSNKLGSWLPGPKPQIQNIDTSTNIITVSMVGNDIGFGNIVQRCLMESDTCYRTYEDRKEIVLLINKQFDRLVDMYTQLERTASDARIYVIGYPSIVKPGGGCAMAGPLTLSDGETVFANDLISYLDSVIQKAAQKAGVYYVGDSAVFNGHRICEGNALDRAVNGVTIEWSNGLARNNSFHPTAFGHELLAQWIEKKTYDFTEPLPRADYTVEEPTANDNLPILQAPKSGRPLNELNYDDNLANDVVYRGTAAKIEHNVGNGLAKAFSTVSGWLHSDPVYLGSFETDSEGNFSASITVPASVPPGFHTLDFYVEGTDGQMQDITKTIYVAASPDDYDGDGVPNTLEPCVIFEIPKGQLAGDGYDCSTTSSINSASSVGLRSVSESALFAETNGEDISSQSALTKAEAAGPKHNVTTTNEDPHPSHSNHMLMWSVFLCLGGCLCYLILMLRRKFI
jgi:hypothetical protein